MEKIFLQITSGHGPAECCRVVALVLERILKQAYWDDIQRIDTLVHTEKMDGENNCLTRLGVFAHSHVAPTTSPWTRQLRERWELMKNDLAKTESATGTCCT